MKSWFNHLRYRLRWKSINWWRDSRPLVSRRWHAQRMAEARSALERYHQEELAKLNAIVDAMFNYPALKGRDLAVNLIQHRRRRETRTP